MGGTGDHKIYLIISSKLQAAFWRWLFFQYYRIKSNAFDYCLHSKLMDSKSK